MNIQIDEISSSISLSYLAIGYKNEEIVLQFMIAYYVYTCALVIWWYQTYIHTYKVVHECSFKKNRFAHFIIWLIM